MYETSFRGWVKHLDFILLDILALTGAFWSAFFIREHMGGLRGDAPYRGLYLVILGLYVLIVFLIRNHSNIIRRGIGDEVGAIAKMNILLLGSTMLYLVFTKQSVLFSRLLLGYIFVINVLLTLVLRLIRKKIVRKRLTDGDNLSRLIVITEAELAEQCLDRLAGSVYQSYTVSGVILLNKPEICEEIRHISVVADENTMMEYLRLNVVDQVLIQVSRSGAETLKLARQLLEMGIVVHIGVDQQMEQLPHKQLGKVGNASVITTSFQTANVLEVFLKRGMDICGALVGLLITAVAFVFVAPMIMIKSPGPIFFSQYRMGRNGRKFKIYKFRSMYMDAEERKKELMEKNQMQGLMFKMDDDPRIIKGIGHFIRNTSIDELPQFWNILRGDMSLVGTRPPTVDEFEQYQLHHKIRLSFRPGLTGMWQVSGRSDITDFEEVVRLDEEYIANWSIWLDIRILLITVGVVLLRKGSR